MPGPYISSENREKASRTPKGRLATGLIGLALTGVGVLYTKNASKNTKPKSSS